MKWKLLPRMWFVVLVVLLAACDLTTPTPTPAPTDTPAPTINVSNQTDLQQRLDRSLTRYTTNDDFSGVALVAVNGDIVLKKAYGFADAKKNIPNRVDTRFQLASVSKTLTASAVMKLVEAGKLNLQSPISTYLSNAPSAWKDITLQHLLSHTSGIPDYFSFDEFSDEMNFTPDMIIKAAAKYPLDFKPGTDYEYSNTNFVLLGKIIENVSGKKYGAFMRETIFDPLQMNATGREENNVPLATGYSSKGRRAEIYPITNELGDGDLLSTVDDLYKFDRALYTDKLLSQASRDKMFTSIGDNNYGLGWEVETWKGKRVISHNGGINGFATELMRFPDQNVTIILLSNFESFDASTTAYRLADLIFK